MLHFNSSHVLEWSCHMAKWKNFQRFLSESLGFFSYGFPHMICVKCRSTKPTMMLEIIPQVLRMVRSLMSRWHSKTNKTKSELLIGGKKGGWIFNEDFQTKFLRSTEHRSNAQLPRKDVEEYHQGCTSHEAWDWVSHLLFISFQQGGMKYMTPLPQSKKMYDFLSSRAKNLSKWP